MMAGRPPNKLVDLVEQKRWNAGNKRHRRALLEQDLPKGSDPALVSAQAVYRQQARLCHRSLWEARRFEALVRDGVL
jgi:hypothetical protein